MYDVLESIGLSKNEAKLYVTLRQNGELNATDASRISGLDRSNTYDILRKLQTKGLLGIMENQGTKAYSACDPEILTQILIEKQRKLESIMPLLSFQEQSNMQVNTYQGLNTLHRFVKTMKDFICVGLPKNEKTIVLNEILKQKKIISISGLDNNTMFIDDKEVLIVSWDKETTILRIRNKAFATFQRNMINTFSLMQSQSSSESLVFPSNQVLA